MTNPIQTLQWMMPNIMNCASYKDTKTCVNEKPPYKLTKKERNKKNVQLADQLHFIG